MRFDDRLATVLAQPAADPSALAAKWRQLVDLLAQRDGQDSGVEVEQALLFLNENRDEISLALLRRIAASLPTAVNPQIEPLVAACAPPDPPRAPAPQPVTNPAVQGGKSQIRDLVARIDALRKAREAGPSETTVHSESFRWETGTDGIVLWAEGAPRGAIIGQTIASPSAGQFGVDGQAAGAFQRRAPFRDARMTIAGGGPAAGEWRLSGVPFFDSRLGHFLGYRGGARRPRMDEVAPGRREVAASDGLFGTELQPDSLRQLIHELRTPLNAILGFAEMIDGQILGPAAAAYRLRASRIREQAGHLMSAVDDLDTAARIETSRFPVEESAVDVVALLQRLREGYGQVAHQRHVSLDMQFDPGLPLARVEPDAAERMFARMLAATIGLAEEGESLSARISLEKAPEPAMLCLSIARPRSIAGLREAQLLDPGFTPQGDWPEAPALGLGFALRLVRNLAETVGGSLVIEDDHFLLRLPQAGASGPASARRA